jgi:desulfoferrodoxin (superoxide reductase-like protein)
MAVRGLWIIERDSGIRIFSKYYRAQDVSDDLFSGYMSALTSFLGELSEGKGKLDKIMSLGSSYSLATQDIKLLVRGFGNLIFVLSFDKDDNEKVMDKTLRRLSEVFRAMYSERLKNNKKTFSPIDFMNFELVMDTLIKSEIEKISKQERASPERVQPLPKDFAEDLRYIKAINMTVNENTLRGFDEKKDKGFPVEEFSRDKKVTVSVLFKRFIHQHFTDWVKLLMEAIRRLDTLPDQERLHVALAYVDGCLDRSPKTTDKYTLDLMFSGSFLASESDANLFGRPKKSGS